MRSAIETPIGPKPGISLPSEKPPWLEYVNTDFSLDDNVQLPAIARTLFVMDLQDKTPSGCCELENRGGMGAMGTITCAPEPLTR